MPFVLIECLLKTSFQISKVELSNFKGGAFFVKVLAFCAHDVHFLRWAGLDFGGQAVPFFALVCENADTLGVGIATW